MDQYTDIDLSMLLCLIGLLLLQVLVHSSWWFSKKATEYLGDIHVCSSVA
jgi:hypothetical protein